MATGRKTKRTPEVEKRIVQALRFGATRKDACAAAGISEDTFARWMASFADFADAVTRAEGECAAMMAAKVYEAGKNGDWRAAESWLKRRRRDEWGDNTALRSDARASAIIAELFPEAAGNNFGEAGAGENPA